MNSGIDFALHCRAFHLPVVKPRHGRCRCPPQEFNRKLTMPALEARTVSSRDAFERKELTGRNLEIARELGCFLAHEMGNNLTPISISLEILERYIEIGRMEKVHDHLKRTRALVEGLERVVEGLTNLIMREEVRSETDAIFLIREVVDFVRMMPEFSSIRFQQRLSPDSLALKIDRAQVREVLLNMILNACEAVSEKCDEGGRLKVASGLTPEGCFEISISDNGTGIREEDLEKLFYRSFSTKRTGAGIGMMISAQVIHRHGGEIEVASIPGDGTTLRIIFPM